MKYKFLNVTTKASDKEEDRTVTVIGSTGDVDRDKDIIDIKGMDTKNYKNNPVILWSHDSSLPPIGKAESVVKSKDGLKFKIKFAEPEINAQADTIFKLFKGGYLNAFSVGFAPDWEMASYNEKRGGFDFPKSELLELSAVNVPANQNALIQRSVEDGIIDEIEAKDFEILANEHPQKISKTYSKQEVDCIINKFNDKVDSLEKRFETPPTAEELDITPEDLISAKEVVSESGLDEIHIVDQALEDIFAASDDKSIDATEDKVEDDDLNSIFTELE